MSHSLKTSDFATAVQPIVADTLVSLQAWFKDTGL